MSWETFVLSNIQITNFKLLPRIWNLNWRQLNVNFSMTLTAAIFSPIISMLTTCAQLKPTIKKDCSPISANDINIDHAIWYLDFSYDHLFHRPCSTQWHTIRLTHPPQPHQCLPLLLQRFLSWCGNPPSGQPPGGKYIFATNSFVNKFSLVEIQQAHKSGWGTS